MVSKKEFTNVDLPMDKVIGAYVQFREMNYFKNARFRQCQEQRSYSGESQPQNMRVLYAAYNFVVGHLSPKFEFGRKDDQYMIINK